ncbi:MAG TPA: diguanylate cyclase, partial [Burkholderiaceae bacterium]
AVLLLALLAAIHVLIRRQLRAAELSRRTIAESAANLSTTLHSIGDAVLATDTEGRITRMNEVAERLTGWPAPQALGRTTDEIFHIVNERTRARAPSPVAQVLATGEVQMLAADTALIARDGSECPIADSAAPIRDGDGRLSGVVLVFRDETLARRAQRMILEQQELLEQRVQERTTELEHVSRALRTLSSGNRVLLRATEKADLLDNMCQVVVNAGPYDMAVVWYRNNDAEQTLRPMAQCGYPGGMDALQQIKPTWGRKEAGQGVVGRAISTGQTVAVGDLTADPYMASLRGVLHGANSAVACPLLVGDEIVGALTIYDRAVDAFDAGEVKLLTELADDLAFGIAGFRARLEQRRIQDEMHRLARYDVLTGLPNGTHFSEHMSEAIAAAERLNQSFAVLQANIERLSEINDALGFSQGDHLLREFGERLRSAVPAAAMVARLRGDEFAVLFPNIPTRSIEALVRQLQVRLSKPFLIADISLDVSAKVGVAIYPDHGRTPNDLFRHTDIAMQQAKREGSPHVIFDPRRYRDQSQRLVVASELRRAIENGDLLLHLQPKVEMATGRVCGAEGLVRWQHATRGLVPPNEFIGLAEHTGLIKPLTEWVLETAMRLGKDWESRACSLPIAVNLSARNLRDESLLTKIQLMLTGWDVTPG